MYKRIIFILSFALLAINVSAAEQKIIVLNSVASMTLFGDEVSGENKDDRSTKRHDVLPELMRNGWKVMGIYPTSDNDTYVLLEK